ncbi:hypothetical protein [Sphingomonas sp.]|uniref:hypothetical protein n=1 Tax=Sphingomonas sp. TaxID=28214 RepID=UPI001DA8E7DE|nr:hypothetical protein [Sphingomonas sp.]MBX9796679.1 hypothetical protein [Sphingomonas sp.]
MPSSNPAWRLTLLGTGIVLMVVSPVVGIIPGPGGIPVFVAGLALTLRNSRRAKRIFVRAKRRWPKLGRIADIGLRRKGRLRSRPDAGKAD